MATKIYVGNLPFNTTEAEVRELFQAFGDIEQLDMINDRETNRFRGFCFITMDDGDAAKAMEALDGHEVGGRNLRVNEARAKENRGGGSRSGGRGRSGGGQRGGDFPDSGGGPRRGGPRGGKKKGGSGRSSQFPDSGGNWRDD